MLKATDFIQQRARRQICDVSKATKNSLSPKHLYQANEMAHSGLVKDYANKNDIGSLQETAAAWLGQ
jgi:hypothetical protein